MSDEDVTRLFPALREFVDAVNDRDLDVMQAALQRTPPITLAILAAGWVGDLRNVWDVRRIERKALKASLTRQRAGHRSELTRVREAHQLEVAALTRRVKQGDAANLALRQKARLQEVELRSSVRALEETKTELASALETITRLQGDLYIAKQRKDSE